MAKKLSEIRNDLLQYVKEFEHIPDEYKDFTKELVIDLFNAISKHMGAVELAYRRTKDEYHKN